MAGAFGRPHLVRRGHVSGSKINEYVYDEHDVNEQVDNHQRVAFSVALVGSREVCFFLCAMMKRLRMRQLSLESRSSRLFEKTETASRDISHIASPLSLATCQLADVARRDPHEFFLQNSCHAQAGR